MKALANDVIEVNSIRMQLENVQANIQERMRIQIEAGDSIKIDDCADIQAFTLLACVITTLNCIEELL